MENSFIRQSTVPFALVLQAPFISEVSQISTYSPPSVRLFYILKYIQIPLSHSVFQPGIPKPHVRFFFLLILFSLCAVKFYEFDKCLTFTISESYRIVSPPYKIPYVSTSQGPTLNPWKTLIFLSSLLCIFFRMSCNWNYTECSFFRLAFFHLLICI